MKIYIYIKLTRGALADELEVRTHRFGRVCIEEGRVRMKYGKGRE